MHAGSGELPVGVRLSAITDRMLSRAKRKAWGVRYLLLMLLATVLVCVGCDDDGGGGGSGDSDSDSDTDTDTDSDTDSDTNSDTDPHDCAGGRYDQSTGLCWQHPRSENYEWQAAIDYCDDLDLAGHTDWHLPSRDDFIELLGDCDSDVAGGGSGFCNLCEESGTCSALFGSDTDWYWSSSSYDSNSAWVAYFSSGGVNVLIVINDRDVRCVRSGP